GKRDAGINPLANMDYGELEQIVAKKLVPPGMELEHLIPQRVSNWLGEVLKDPDAGRRLGHFGDPQNLIAVPRELHAAFDFYAKFGRNPELQKEFAGRIQRALDDRDEFPFGNMSKSQLEAVEQAIKGKNPVIKSKNPVTKKPVNLRELLDAEWTRRRNK